MPKFSSAKTTRDSSRELPPDTTPPAPSPSPRPDRGVGNPLAWTLGGASQPRPDPGAGNHERRREPAPQRKPASVDVRRRHNPSSRFRG